jgi:hypothetical protein
MCESSSGALKMEFHIGFPGNGVPRLSPSFGHCILSCSYKKRKVITVIITNTVQWQFSMWLFPICLGMSTSFWTKCLVRRKAVALGQFPVHLQKIGSSQLD